MATFQVAVTDNSGAAISNATIVFVDEAGNEVANNASLQTDSNGNVTFTNGSSAVNVKVTAYGYNVFPVTLQPGVNNVKLNKEAQGPEVTITANASNFWQKHKTLLIILGLLLLVYMAYKFKWFGGGVTALIPA